MPRFVIFKDDLPKTIISAGKKPPNSIKIADNADLKHLRFDGTNVVDATTVATWLIDPDGQKRLPEMHAGSGWQSLDCQIDDALILDAGLWRLKTVDDDLVAAQLTAKRRVIAFADMITDTVMAAYPKAEVASWSEQAAQARRVGAGETLGADELLTKLAAKAGVTAAVYAASVLVKVAAFEAITVEVKGLRDQSGAAIDAVTDPAGIEPLLMTLKAEAGAIATSLGIVI